VSHLVESHGLVTESETSSDTESNSTVTDITEEEVSTDTELDDTVIEDHKITMASGGHIDDIPRVDPPRVTDSIGPMTTPGVTTPMTVAGGSSMATTGSVDVMSLMSMMMDNMREERKLELEKREEERQRDREHEEKRWKEMGRSATPTDTPRTPQVSLPKLKMGDDVMWKTQTMMD